MCLSHLYVSFFSFSPPPPSLTLPSGNPQVRGSHCFQSKAQTLMYFTRSQLLFWPHLLPFYPHEQTLNILTYLFCNYVVQSTFPHLVNFCSPPMVCLRCHLALGENVLACSLGVHSFVSHFNRVPVSFRQDRHRYLVTRIQISRWPFTCCVTSSK